MTMDDGDMRGGSDRTVLSREIDEALGIVYVFPDYSSIHEATKFLAGLW